jgi:hypothetical protein
MTLKEVQERLKGLSYGRVKRKSIDNNNYIVYDKNGSALNPDGYLHCFTEEELNADD